MLAHYNGGYKAGRAVMRGQEPPAKETRDYLRLADSYTANLPSGNPAGSPNQAQRVELRLEGMMRDAMHNQVADILPIQQTIQIPMAAGAG